MAQKQQRPQLVIEWDRDWVRVRFVESGQRREATSLAGVEGVGGKTALVVLSRRLILHRAMPLPDATRADTLIVLKQKLGDVFPIPVSELAFDYIPTTRKGEEGRICDVFATRTSDIKALLDSCEALGITVQQIVPAEAFAIKVAQDQGLTSGILAERFGDLVSLDGFRDGELVSSKVVGLDHLDSEITRLKAMTGEKVLASGIDLGGSEQKLGTSVVSSDIPLLIDLEPEEYRTKKAEAARKKNHRQAYIVFAGGLCVALLVGNAIIERNEKRAKGEEGAKKLLKMSKMVLTAKQGELTKISPKAKQLRLGFEPAQKTSDITKVASMLVPKGAWLTGLTLERGKLLQLRGSAKSSEAVAQYVGELTKQSRFRDVRLVFANAGEIEGQKIVQFSITAFPVGNLPLLETSKKKK